MQQETLSEENCLFLYLINTAIHTGERLGSHVTIKVKSLCKKRVAILIHHKKRFVKYILLRAELCSQSLWPGWKNPHCLLFFPHMHFSLSLSS